MPASAAITATLARWSLELGGHCRTGLEDNVRLDKETLAPSNAALVAQVARLCDEYGRRPAHRRRGARAPGLEAGPGNSLLPAVRGSDATRRLGCRFRRSLRFERSRLPHHDRDAEQLVADGHGDAALAGNSCLCDGATMAISAKVSSPSMLTLSTATARAAREQLIGEQLARLAAPSGRSRTSARS